ncbi:hypothetical protein BDV23DRAFT_182460 [Aspergillus alliaceus]|uniref:Uncharacterized protein n=1 Tax=Petromyces alliaceus TaxID=209559 RepID=A0A5N7CB69_PETAA|nr:hypothetical protein BDV23DRAFT_182460 [Aspergillus alliaceus]
MKTILTLGSLLLGAGIAFAAPTPNGADVQPESAHSFKINAYSPPPSTSEANNEVTPDSKNLFIIHSYGNPNEKREADVEPDAKNLFIIHSYGNPNEKREADDAVERRSQEDTAGTRVFNMLAAYRTTQE